MDEIASPNKLITSTQKDHITLIKVVFGRHLVKVRVLVRVRVQITVRLFKQQNLSESLAPFLLDDGWIRAMPAGQKEHKWRATSRPASGSTGSSTNSGTVGPSSTIVRLGTALLSEPALVRMATFVRRIVTVRNVTSVTALALALAQQQLDE